MWQTIRLTGVQVLAKAMTVGMGLIAVRWLTRSLGVEGYGNLVLMTSVFLLFDAAADFGTRLIGVREMVEAGESRAKGVWQRIVGVRVILTTVLFMVGWGFLRWYPGFEMIKNEAFWGLVMIWGTMLAGSMEMVWQYQRKLEYKSAVEILFPAIFLAIFGIGGGNFSLLSIMQLYVLARVVSLVAGGWWLREWFGGGWVRWNREGVRKFLVESWPMGVYLLLFTGYDRAIDSMVIRHYFGVAEVGWYGLAYKIYSNLVMPAYFLVSSAYPLLAKDGLKNRVFKQSRIILLGMVMLGVPIVYLLAPMAINVLATGEFGQSVVVLRILLIALVFSYLNHINGFMMISNRKQKDLLWLGGLVLAFNLIGNLIMVPRWGIIGAAWVTVGSEMIMWILTSKRI